jgi:acyl carrier protein
VTAPPPEDPLLLATVCALCAEALRVDSFAADDDFFARGGDSLSAVRLLTRVKRTFGVRLSPVEVFDRGTATGIAEAVRTLLAPSGPDPGRRRAL